jgi:WD40 repeat protein
MYTYDSSKDVVAAKFEALSDMSALSVAESKVLGSNPSARWHFGRHALNDAAFSPDCRYLVVVNGAGMCRVLDVELDRPNIVAGFKSYYAGFNAVTWSPCGRYVITGGESDMLEIWGLYEREVVAWGCGGHRSWITDVTVDERAAGEGHRFLRIASVGEDCRVAFWDWHVPDDDDFGDTRVRDSDTALADHTSRLSVGAARTFHRTPSFAGPDANVVQSAHRDEVERLVPIMTHKLHTSPVTAVRFTAEAALTATLDEIKLWRRPSHPSRYVHDVDL